MALSKLDLTRNGQLTIARTTVKEIKAIGNAARAKVGAAISKEMPSGLSGLNASVTKALGGVRANTLSAINLARAEAFDNILTTTQAAMGVELSTAQTSAVANAMKSIDIFGGLSVEQRLDISIRRVLSSARLDLIAGDVESALNRLAMKGGFEFGASLERQSSRLAFSELNRYAQHLQLEILSEMGYTRFAWVLSSLHAKLTPHPKKGKKHEVEICEVRAKAGPYTLKQMKKLLPPHPYCMCHAEGVE